MPLDKSRLSHVSLQDPELFYDLKELVGTGSYGQVYKATSKTDNIEVAVKVIKLEPNEDISDVLNEVMFLKECSDERITKYLGCYMKKGAVKGEKIIWIVMEYMGGGSVEGIIKSLKTPLRELEIKAIVKECVLGLAFLHSEQKIHRDIKCGIAQ
jgi:serine/threonine protein kinase